MLSRPERERAALLVQAIAVQLFAGSERGQLLEALARALRDMDPVVASHTVREAELLRELADAENRIGRLLAVVIRAARYLERDSDLDRATRELKAAARGQAQETRLRAAAIDAYKLAQGGHSLLAAQTLERVLDLKV